MGINKVILVGNVGRDTELRALPSGSNLAKFTLATSEPRFKDQDGKPHTEWHNIVVWGRRDEFCGQYVTKGRQLYLEGRIRRHEYEKNGQRMFFTEVHADIIELLGSRSDAGGGGYPDSSYRGGGGPSGGGSGSYGGGGEPSGGDGPSFPEDVDEDVPF